MKTIEANPNYLTDAAFDPGIPLPQEAIDVTSELIPFQPQVKIYSDADNEAISKSHTH